jgi:hypothetical protein
MYIPEMQHHYTDSRRGKQEHSDKIEIRTPESVFLGFFSRKGGFGRYNSSHVPA